MKTLFTLLTIILNLSLFSQTNLTTSDLKSLRKYEMSTVNEMLTKKGWELDYMHESDGNKFAAGRWYLKNKSGIKTSYFELQIAPKNDAICKDCNFTMLAGDRETFLKYKKQISSNPNFKQIPGKIAEGEVSDYYYSIKDNVYMKFKTLKENEYTHYIIECHSKDSRVMEKEIYGI